ncbi:MAG TPA: hypothetical protein VFS00_16525, partial [Polyangiaceae bacterium]|nr:hypothetical protein [Polyangiaceae bacterium]
MTVAPETTTAPPPGGGEGAARPASRLSLSRIEEASRRIDPAFLASPQFVSEPLSEALGCRLTVKVETVNPVRCFKGRGADFFVAALLDRGRPPPLASASAGNFG